MSSVKPTTQAPLIGQILIEEGVITEAQLENALHEQKRNGRRFGEVLVGTGACSEADIAEALAGQLNLRLASFDAEDVDRELLSQLGNAFLRTKVCLPLKSNANEIRLAVADPFDIETTEEIQRSCGLPVSLEVSTHSTIMGLLDAIGDRSDHIEGMIEEAKAKSGGVSLSESELLSATELVHTFLSQGIRRGASDLHVEPEADLIRVRYRVDGVLTAGTMVPKELSSAVIARIKLMSRLDISERRLPQDGRARIEVDGRGYDLRVSIIPTVTGECCVLRVLDSSRALRSLESMGFQPDAVEYLKEVIKRPHGLFLVTGPTGSGKSTTLYGMLAKVNALQRKVVTVEDPVEYRLPLIRQVQVHHEIGMSFAASLRSILRQDPDVILIGEIRDKETAEIAIQAAMTGHIVFSTLHANTAIGAVARLANIGIDPMMITSTLCGVMSQRLVRKLCDHCKHEGASVDANSNSRLSTGNSAAGCVYCNQSGYLGRHGLQEILTLSKEVRRMILAGATEDEIHEQAVSEGFRTLYQDGQAKVAAGITTSSELERVVQRD